MGKQSTCITYLDVRANEIREGGARELARVLELNTSITDLQIDRNLISPAVLERLDALVEENQMIAKRRRRAVSAVYLCAMSGGNVLEAMPAELIWELERWIAVVYVRK